MEICTLSFKVSDRFEGFQLLFECGSGAFGQVFLAENLLSGQRVALKIIAKNGRSFERELKGVRDYIAICRRTDLLQIYHVAENDDYFYYTMEAADNASTQTAQYVPDTLGNRLRRSGALDVDLIRTMARELLLSLKTLHAKGVCHRDLKPDNILWVDGRAVPGDIGLVSGDAQTMIAGTPGFMTPEVLSGVRAFTTRDDDYALGKILYCALTGMPAEKFPSFPENRTLSDCADIVALYNRLCAGETVEIPPEAPKRPRRSKKLVIAGAAFLLLTLLIAVGIYRFAGEKRAKRISRVELQKSVTKSAPALPDETVVAELRQQLESDWENYRKTRLWSAQNIRRMRPHSSSPESSVKGDLRRMELESDDAARDLKLALMEHRLDRLDQVARFYLQYFPDVWREKSAVPGEVYWGTLWLLLQQEELSGDDQRQMACCEKLIAERYPDAADRRKHQRALIYLALRSSWTIDEILLDADFPATLKKQAELLRNLP